MPDLTEKDGGLAGKEATDVMEEGKNPNLWNNSEKAAAVVASSSNAAFIHDNELSLTQVFADPEAGTTSTYYVPETMNDRFLAEQAFAVESFNRSIRANSGGADSGVAGSDATTNDAGSSTGGQASNNGLRPGAFAIPGTRTSQRTDDNSDISSQISRDPSDIEAPQQAQQDTTTATPPIAHIEARLVEEAVPAPVYEAQPLPPRPEDFLSSSALEIQNVQMDMDSSGSNNGSDAGEHMGSNMSEVSASSTRSTKHQKRKCMKRTGLYILLLTFAIAIAVIVGSIIGIRDEAPDGSSSSGVLIDSAPCQQSSDCVSGACGLDGITPGAEFVCCPSGETVVWTFGQLQQQSYCARHLPPGSACPMSPTTTDASSGSMELCQIGECQAGTCPLQGEQQEEPEVSTNENINQNDQQPTMAPVRAPTKADLTPCESHFDCSESVCSNIYGLPTSQHYCCPADPSTTPIKTPDNGEESYCKYTIPVGDPCPSELEFSEFLCETMNCIAGFCVNQQLGPGGVCEKDSDCSTLACTGGFCV